MIPPAVRSETIETGKSEGYTDAIALEKLEKDGWLKTMRLSRRSTELASDLSEALGDGEAEAIALAIERKERLFMDDLKGRRTAESYRIETTSTLGIIFEMLVGRVLPRIDYIRNVKNYASRGWISGDILEEFVQRGEEV
jgi:predicted nucleic acid-binding protein